MVAVKYLETFIPSMVHGKTYIANKVFPVTDHTYGMVLYGTYFR